jgi:hypothetical protein
MSDLEGDYRAIKCEVCGVPWDDHTDACPRHGYRPECRGMGRGGRLECCPRAGLIQGMGRDGRPTFVCPRGCSCHQY